MSRIQKPHLNCHYFLFKVLLRHFVLDLFKHQRQELSDDERDEDEEDEKDDEKEDAVSDKEGDKEKNGGSKVQIQPLKIHVK